jgi:NHL repeat-containing protein
MAAHAVQPMHGYHDLVAGEGLPGFRDGMFTTARFNHPQGLAQSEDGRFLYVADRDNQRVRLIDLDRQNAVKTVCGNGREGYQDGACDGAMFSAPSQLLMLPGQRLLVLDSGNRRFRLVDLQGAHVTTLTVDAEGGGSVPLEVGDVWTVVHDAPNDLLYFSEPAAGKVRRYDLSKRRVQDVARTPPGPLNPAALGIWNDDLYISDQTAPQIYAAKLSPATEPAILALEEVSGQGPFLGFADGPDSPLGLRGNAPVLVPVRPPPVPEVQMLTAEGQSFSAQPKGQQDLLRVPPDRPPGWLADRRFARRYFYSSYVTHSVLSLADYRFASLPSGTHNSEGLDDFEYPLTKPPNTYRILIVGDSRTSVSATGWPQNRMLSFPKQLELLLNTRSALQDRGVQFEVLLVYKPIDDALTLWPYYVVPDLVERYDIDLVLTMAFPVLELSVYSFRPITAEGLPAPRVDPEFLLQKFESRLGAGVYRKFYDECRQKGYVQALPNGDEGLVVSTDEIVRDAHLRGTLIEMLAPAVRALSDKLVKIGSRRGRRVGMLLAYCPLIATYMFDVTDEFRDVWQAVVHGTETAFLDLTPPIRALVPTYFPTSDEQGGCHETPSGFRLLAEVLANALIDAPRSEKLGGQPDPSRP